MLSTRSAAQSTSAIMASGSFEYLIKYIVLYIIFSTFVYAGIEFIKSIYKIFSKDKPMNNKAVKILSFCMAYSYAWIFRFKLAILMLQLSSDNIKSTMNDHVNYFIIATLIYVGSKKIWEHLSKFKEIKDKRLNN